MLKGIGLVLLAGFFGWAGWFYFSFFNLASAHIRYSLNVVLEVDGVPQTHSVVQEMYIGEISPLIRQVNDLIVDAYGEALYIEIDGLDPLIVPLKSIGGKPGSVPYSYILMEACLPRKQWSHMRGIREYIRTLEKLEGPCTLPRAAWPIFITLPDPTDYENIFYVDADNLAGTYSPRVSISKLYLGKTNAPMSNGIEKKLPWIEELHGSPTSRRLSIQNFPLNTFLFATAYLKRD